MQNLTAAQLATLKADILADQAFSALFARNDADSDQAIADAYNLAAAPDFFVWSTSVDVGAIYDAIDFTKYTPSDDPNQSGAARGVRLE
jgi:hypothetical protein